MKKIYLNILAAVILMFSGYSCSAGWLDLEPSDEAGAETAIENYRDAEIALNGVYSMIKGQRDPANTSVSLTEYYMRDMIYYGDVRADDMQVNAESSGRPNWLYYLTFTGTSGANNMWKVPYKVINRANRLISYIEAGAVVDAKKEKVDNLEGQALMARALAHFDLLRLYSLPYDVNVDGNGEKLGVPIVLKAEDYTYQPSRSTINAVYAQVLKDLDEAVAKMVVDNKAGYFNKWTAKAFQARVYQYMGNDAKAFEIAEDVIANGPYKLWSNQDYTRAWKLDPNSQAGTEVLFQIMITSQADWTDREGIAYLYDIGGYADLHITKKFYDKLNSSYAGDVRLSMLVEDEESNFPGKNIWLDKYGVKEGANVVGLGNIPLFRLSETYLIAAESAAKLSKSDKAAKYLNEIVRRGNPNADELTDSQATVDRILEERRVELYGEGHRYFDLIRNNKEIVRHSGVEGEEGWHSPLRPEAIKYDRKNFRAILPIPKEEIDANAGLIGQQNPGY